MLKPVQIPSIIEKCGAAFLRSALKLDKCARQGDAPYGDVGFQQDNHGTEPGGTPAEQELFNDALARKDL